MKLIEQSIEILYPETNEDWIRELKGIENAYRTCYKSNDKITDNSWETFLPKFLNHKSPHEHGKITVKIICSRAIQQELTRHRLAAYSIESTRWIDYNKKQNGELLFIKPSNWNEINIVQQLLYTKALKESEKVYLSLRQYKIAPERARDVLPLALASEIIMTANFREWNHIFDERAFNETAHIDIQTLMLNLYNKIMNTPAKVLFERKL